MVFAAPWFGLIFFPSLLYLTRGGGARLRRPSRERTLHIELVFWPLEKLLRRGDIPNNLSVNGAGNAVLELQVHLGNGVLGEDRGIGDITCPTCQSSLSIAPVASVADVVRSGHRVRDVRMAADSTMLRMVNLLIALSLGVHREQLLQRMGLTWPRPFLFRPLSWC